jgi:hypothetical protein
MIVLILILLSTTILIDWVIRVIINWLKLKIKDEHNQDKIPH